MFEETFWATYVDSQYVKMEVRTVILWGCTSTAGNNIGYSSYWPAVFRSAAVVNYLLKVDAPIDSEWEAQKAKCLQAHFRWYK